MLVTFVSAKGSPGVTTAVLAVAAEWPEPRPAVVIDADPAGGDIPAGLGQGDWPRDATLVGLAGAARNTAVAAALQALVYRPAEHAPLVLGGVTTPGQAQALPWPQLLAGLQEITDADLLCDGGRYQPGGGIEPLLHGSDHIVLVTRSTLPAVRAAVRISELLRDLLPPSPGPTAAARAGLSLLVVAPGRPYGAAEIAAHCGAHLLGELPHDPAAAVVWSEGRTPQHRVGGGLWRGRFWHSPLQRAAGKVADRLAEPVLAHGPAPHDAPVYSAVPGHVRGAVGGGAR